MHYKKIKLPNGLRIILAPMQETQTATVLVMIGVGSRYEKESEAGLSHFIEHMFFKGTKKRPTTLHISEEMDAIGGEFNAFTSKDVTAYYAKADSKHLKTALDVIADIYLNSKMEVQEIEKEKGTIIQEISMREDNPMGNVGDIFEKLLYQKNSLGRNVIGYKKTIASFQRKNFMDYLERFYVANDTVISVAGKFNKKEVMSQLQKYFRHMKKGKRPPLRRISEKQKNPEAEIKFKKTDQTHFILGNRAYPENHKDRFVLALLSIILGGNMSSRLFIEVREKRGLAYYVRTSVDTYQDCGYLATQAGVEHKNLALTVKTILAEYKKIATEKVTEKDLQRAKDYIKGKSVMGLESSDEVAMFFITQEIRKQKIMTIQEMFRRIDKVSTSDILRVAKDIFQPAKLNLAVIGPHKNQTELKASLKI